MDIAKEYAKVDVKKEEWDNGDLLFANYFSAPPMFFTKDLATVPFENRFNGGHAFLIAGGPSFGELDHKLLWKAGVLTMGINNSAATFRPNLWTCVDSPSNFLASIWQDPQIEKIVPISHINKRLFDSSKWKDVKITVGDCPNVFYYRRNEVVNTEDFLLEDTFNWGNHSKVGGGRSVFMAAVKILYVMGIRQLYLLGVDFHMDKDHKYHFPQDRSKSSIKGNNNTYASMIQWFEELKSQFDEAGYKVYNCNEKSALKAFPFMPFEEAITAATSHMVDVLAERSEGMYSRRTDEEKEEKKKKAEEIAKQYTEEDRIEVKKKLDFLRTELDNAKEVLFQYLQGIFPEDAREVYLWAHKLQKPKTEGILELYNNLKLWMTSDEKPKDPSDSKLIKIQKNIEEARKAFRDCEKEKNKIWGIVN